jgi:predicted acyl esterase
MAESEGEALRVDRDVAMPMRDGTRLFANVYRGPGAGARPVLLSVTPYGKDRAPDRLTPLLMRLAGVQLGDIRASRYTSFEAPDPLAWAAEGYIVVQADARGMHRSEGHGGVLRRRDAEDYYDVIEWVAHQPWCSGRVGLMGVSYLAMAQWAVAGLRPPHLCAMVPWEGVSDLYRELAFHGGIPETRFVPTWVRMRLRRGRNRRFPLEEDFLEQRADHPLDDPFWASKRPALENIDVPALVCANWSDHGLHTRGSLEAFERMPSRRKWLFTHGRKKWETFYGAEAFAHQKRFLDHFLAGADNGQETLPQVRLEVRTAYYRQVVRSEAAWPLPTQQPATFYLCPSKGSLEPEYPRSGSTVRYRPAARGEEARFTRRFERPTELVGSMRLKLWVSTSEGDDLDLFVVVRKLGADGREVFFSGYNGYGRDAVAKGWLRASHRQLDSTRSMPTRPWHLHRALEKVRPDQIVPLEIEIWPSATLFEAGTSLQLCILGHDAAAYPGFRHTELVNRGLHTIHAGGAYDSHLVMPVNIPIGSSDPFGRTRGRSAG